MRVASLELLAFGPFRGLSLDLSAPGVHLVFGRNEAGKSTTLRAITGLLYGIDTRTQDAHVHKPAELRIGGTLVSDDGARVRVVRRKGVSKGGPNTLLDERGQALDEAIVHKLLGGVSEETFRHAFGLDHDTLQLGARALLEGRGDIGGSLFDASVGGGGDARRLLEELGVEAERLYKPRGVTTLLNVALKSFADLQKAVKERQSLPEAYVAQQKALGDAQARRADLAARRVVLAARKVTIEAARQRLPLEQRRARLVVVVGSLLEVARHAPRIASLHARLAAYELASRVHRDDTTSAERLRDRIVDVARRAAVPAASTALRIDGRVEARIQRLVVERTTLTERLETARAEIARNERELARIRAGLCTQEAVDPAIMASLVRAASHARSLGDATARHASQTSKAQRRRKEVEAKASAIGRFEGTVEALVALTPPASTFLEAALARATELERALARHADRLVELELQTASIEQQLAEATGDFAPPTAADLRAAREARDAAWSLVRGAHGLAVEASARASLDVAFDRAVRDADVIADRMIVEADRVTTLARLQSRQATNAEQRASALAERQRVARERETLDEEHRAAWAEAGIVASDRAPGSSRELSIAEMRPWLAKHAHVVEAFTSVREAELDAEETARAIAEATTALSAALSSAGARVNDGALVELLDEASARVARSESATRAEADSAKAVAKLVAEIEERRAAAERDEVVLVDVRARLTELVAPLGVLADASAEEIARTLESLRELFSLEDQRAAVESRAAAAGREARTFEEEAARVVADVALDLVGLPAGDAVAELAARLGRAQAAAQELGAIDAQLALHASHRRAPGSLGEERLEDDLAALVADPETATRALDEASAALGEVEHALSRADHEIGGVEKGLEAVRADSGAAEASAQAQEALARVRACLERYVRVKVAAVVLAREIERYREENQGPMLVEAARLFARLTLGRYTGVRAGYDDRDRPALRCVREGNIEVDVTGLSEGTRDQLYLSLRLASILRYAEVAESMPLVLDDVLVQFDDERSRAALGIVAELSTRMQVLFFTHHARMVDLARDAVPVGLLTVHELANASARTASFDERDERTVRLAPLRR